jgi:hypothetical protein
MLGPSAYDNKHLSLPEEACIYVRDNNYWE